MKELDSYLTLEVKQRLHDMHEGKKDIPVSHIRKKKKLSSTLQLANMLTLTQEDGITWVIEASTTKDQRAVRRIVQQVISVFFASAHQLPVVRHPREQEPKMELIRRCVSFLCSRYTGSVSTRNTRSFYSTRSKLC